MTNVSRSKWTPKPMRALMVSLKVSLGIALLTSMISGAATHAATCPHKDALGTSRILTVDAAATPRVGLKSFPQTLPLEDHEVVLTFDDGPWPATTPKVLAALARECVHATFFLIGKPASEHPELVRRIAAEGHTVGHHSWTHPTFSQIKPKDADPFRKGDSVVYPAHGVGRIERVGFEDIAGHRLNLIHISFDDNQMTLRVPVAQARAAGLRKLASRQELADAMGRMRGRPRVSRLMWAKRAQDYLAKIPELAERTACWRW